MLLPVCAAFSQDAPPIPEVISYNFHVRPILSENCYFCHGPDSNHREAGLRLDTESGYAHVVDSKNPGESDLIARILAEDEGLLMPPAESGRQLSMRQKEIVRKWVQQGATYQSHWAFRAPEQPAVPNVEHQQWPRNPIDHFVLRQLEQRRIAPSPRAKPQVLVRRLYLDLIGLPPTPQQSQDFLDDYAANGVQAVDRLADDLFDSPHYGERMALPWLDAARYSDSNGFQEDGDRTQWPWRDWVVEALNSNMPFDQFTIEQLAGDLLPTPTQEQLVATAFNRNHMLNGEGGAIAEEQRNNYVFDRVDTTATTWLGLTMACAQCHDHKYDPITQKDYYRFFAFFNTIDERGGVDRKFGRSMNAQPVMELPTTQQNEKLASIAADSKPIQDALRAEEEEIIKAMRAWEAEARKQPAPKNMGRDIFNLLVKSPEERGQHGDRRLKNWFLQNMTKNEKWRQLYRQQRKLDGERANTRSKILTIMIMREQKKPRHTYVLKRGDYLARGERVSTGVPEFLPELSTTSGKSNRLDLASWLVSPSNPLTSRVQVNRNWQTFFGTGLVKTAEDFGVQGELPSHPQLLDWLAVDFRDNGWDVKRLNRLIVTSETYLQSSKFRQDLKQLDPANRLLARSPRLRLASSLIRDASLSVAGLLNPKVGGSPVYPPQPPRLWKEFSLERFGYTPSSGEDLYRRSLYTFWRRTVPPPNMFDASNRQTCTVRTNRTNTPLHALTLLNDPTYVEAACHLAMEILEQGLSEDRDRVATAFVRSLGRQATKSEDDSLQRALKDARQHYSRNLQDARDYVSTGPAVIVPSDETELIELASLSNVVQIIMNTDEFMTRE